MKTNTSCYRRYRFPREIIGHGVWLYDRFCLSFRDFEELLAKRTIIVTYETIRPWCRKFEPECARKLKHRRGRLGDVWHLDEVFFKIRAEHHRPWVPSGQWRNGRSYSGSHGLARGVLDELKLHEGYAESLAIAVGKGPTPSGRPRLYRFLTSDCVDRRSR